ncbi:hypothetical protein LG047_02260 [Methylocystis sp. WRRC1]|uniref:hypothetical protein n=1 Tax=Methylocystis sp. WRRC1 TaxID=1732014 RepID=UPI001D1566DB|nr:hypothetical protein [Methylocystis sp. WRRC1]MCC3244155.1 hypothetical protein [Methylocystis sp. WRRC1]
MKTRISTDDLAAAREAGVIDAETFERLLRFLAARASAHAPAHQAPRYDFVNLLWYAGALIVLGAMGMFSTTAFGLWGDKALLTTAVIYAVLFTLAGAYLWRRDLRTPGGLLVTCAVGMAPLGIFALQSLWGHSPVDDGHSYREFYVWIKSSWLPMELGTIAAALLALIAFPFPFLVMIIAFCLWFMSMDLTPWLMGITEFSWEQRATVSMYFGLLVLAVAWLVDLKRWKNGDFAFWLHLFGLMAFWGGLTAQHSGDEFGKAMYCAINVGLVVLSLFLMRRVYAVFGAVGVTMYLGHLAWDVFKDSILFPFALSGIGVLLIAFGLLFHKYGKAVSDTLGELMPAHLRFMRPVHAREER